MNAVETTAQRRPGRPVTRGFEKVNTGHPGGDCWLWDGAKTRDGYGMLKRQGYMGYAHRYYFEQLLGPIPAGKQLDHLCGIRSCCNPAHLQPVTAAENVRRSRVAKLNTEKVKAIRDMWGRKDELGLRQKDIGKIFGVTQPQISYIVNGKEWRDIN